MGQGGMRRHVVKLYKQPGMLIKTSKLLPRRSGAHVREKTLGVVDIGSNTVHLLVARTNGQLVETVVDESEGLRLGADVDDTGALSEEKLQELVVTLIRFRDQAVAENASEIHLLATQALRIATNQDAVLKEL